jgi:hypothetical protein
MKFVNGNLRIWKNEIAVNTLAGVKVVPRNHLEAHSTAHTMTTTHVSNRNMRGQEPQRRHGRKRELRGSDNRKKRLSSKKE